MNCELSGHDQSNVTSEETTNGGRPTTPQQLTRPVSEFSTEASVTVTPTSAATSSITGGSGSVGTPDSSKTDDMSSSTEEAVTSRPK